MALIEGATDSTRVATAAQRVPFVASMIAVSAGIVWSFGAVTARKADGADAFQYLIWRSVAIIVVIEIVAIVRRRPAVTPPAFRSGPLMLVACLGLLLASIAFVYALKNTSPANAVFLASVTPLIAVLLGKVVLGEPLTRITAAAVALGFVGLCITVIGDLDAGNMRGNVAALASSVGFAVYTVCLRADRSRDWSPVMPGYAVMMIVICALVTTLGDRTLMPPADDIALAAVHGGVFIVVGTLLFNHSSRQIPAAAMAVCAQSEMVFVPLWAFLVLRDRPTLTSLAGGLVILIAVVGKALLDARRLPTPGPVR